MTTTDTGPQTHYEVVVSFSHVTDERVHAYDGNEQGRTACGLSPDLLVSRRAWKIVPFERCEKCAAALAQEETRA